MNVIYKNQIIKLSRDAVSAVNTAVKDFELPAKKFIDDGLVNLVTDMLRRKKELESLDIQPVKMTPRMIKESEKMRSDYNDPIKRKKNFSPAFSNAEDATAYLNSL